MSNGLKIVIASAAALAWYYLRGVSRVTVGIKGFSVDHLDLAGNIVFLPVFQITNPSGVSVTPNSLIGTLYVNNAEVGSVNQRFSGSVAAHAITSIPIQVSCPFSKLGDGIRSLIESGSIRNMVVRFDGSLVIGSVTIPVRISRSWGEMMEE